MKSDTPSSALGSTLSKALVESFESPESNQIPAFELEVRIRNNALKQRRQMLGLTQTELALKASVGLITICRYEAIKTSPKKINGEWKATALQLAAFFEVPAETLWPRTIFEIKQSVLIRKVEARNIRLLYQVERARLLDQEVNPEKLLESREEVAVVHKALKLLSSREERMLALRFGLGEEEPHTLKEVAKAFNRSPARIKVIIERALKRLKQRTYRDITGEKSLPKGLTSYLCSIPY